MLLSCTHAVAFGELIAVFVRVRILETRPSPMELVADEVLWSLGLRQHSGTNMIKAVTAAIFAALRATIVDVCVAAQLLTDHRTQERGTIVIGTETTSINLDD